MIEEGYYTIGGRGPFKTKRQMNDYLRSCGVKIPKIRFWDCPKCGSRWKDSEVRHTNRSFRGLVNPFCPDCLNVSLIYFGMCVDE